jgi:Tat protein secretion system quality control protein TatD with DNase activity
MSLVDDIIDAGHYLSVTPVMIKSAKDRKIIDCVAMERVLTGTDGPYLKAGDRLTNPPM